TATASRGAALLPGRLPCRDLGWIDPADAADGQVAPGPLDGGTTDPLAEEQQRNGAQGDLRIEPQRGVLDVPDVERRLVERGDLPAADHLCPAGDAGANQQTQGEFRRLLDGKQGARTDERHVAHE